MGGCEAGAPMLAGRGSVRPGVTGGMGRVWVLCFVAFFSFFFFFLEKSEP